MNAHLGVPGRPRFARCGFSLHTSEIRSVTRVHVGGRTSLSLPPEFIWAMHMGRLAALSLFGCFSALRLHVSHSVAFMVVSCTCCVNVNTTVDRRDNRCYSTVSLYCPLRIHTPYVTPYETRSMRALAALRMEWASCRAVEFSGKVLHVNECRIEPTLAGARADRTGARLPPLP